MVVISVTVKNWKLVKCISIKDWSNQIIVYLHNGVSDNHIKGEHIDISTNMWNVHGILIKQKNCDTVLRIEWFYLC